MEVKVITYIILFLVAVITIIVIKKIKKYNAENNNSSSYINRNNGTNTVRKISTPPPLPVQRPRTIPLPSMNTTRTSVQVGVTQSSQPQIVRRMIDVNSFPKCPIHKCRNRPGEVQMIFWDPTNEKYMCHRGHYFTGRE